MNYTARFFSLFLAGFILGCNPYRSDLPPRIHFGRDVCDECRMVISEERFAAAFLDSEGNLLKFDEIGCLVLNRMRQAQEPKYIWVHDYETNAWIDGRKAVYVRAETLSTPMARGLVAFSNPDAAKRFAQKEKGVLVSWEELEAIMKKETRVHLTE